MPYQISLCIIAKRVATCLWKDHWLMSSACEIARFAFWSQ